MIEETHSDVAEKESVDMLGQRRLCVCVSAFQAVEKQKEQGRKRMDEYK